MPATAEYIPSTTTTNNYSNSSIIKKSPPFPRACFSFAAYSKSLISHLHSSGIPISPGLSDSEFTSIESSHSFQFPPDLRAILSHGLPLSPSFPNWRLPQTHPLPTSPKLIPIFNHFYIPSSHSPGNPVFYVCGNLVRCSGFDLADFFSRRDIMPAPSWAATAARRVDLWSDLVDEAGLDTWMKGIEGKLTEAGWTESEVTEMLGDGGDVLKVRDRVELLWHVRVLALVMLRGGWSGEDVVYSLGCGGGGGDGVPGRWRVDGDADEIEFNFFD